MYASAWIFVIAPIVVSFSTSEPRPITTSSPTDDPLAHARLVAEDHARADLRAGEDHRAGGDDRPVADLGGLERLSFGRRARRERRLLADDRVLEHLHAVAELRPRIDDRGRVDLGLNRHAQALRQELERAHDLEAVAHLAPVPALLHEPHEVRALEPQRLGVRELGAEGVARARPPLAVRLGRLLRRLVVDRDLVLELHVVEDGHLVAARRP